MHDALIRLENALVLEENSSFHIVICPARLELNEWLTNLGARLDRPGNEERTLQRLDPYTRLLQADQALLEDDMVEAVLRPLLEPPSGHHPRGLIHIIDASLLHPRDEACWRWLFRRMNELRNRTMRSRRDALLLAGIPRAELLFAEQAPDFWSIRTGEAQLPTQARAPLPITIPPERLLLDTLDLCSWPMSEEHAAQLARARDAIRRRNLAEARLLIQSLLSRVRELHGNWHQDTGSMLEIFLAIEQAISSPVTGSKELEYLARSLRKLSWAERLLAERSAWFLLLLAETLEFTNDPGMALDWYEEAFDRFFFHWGGGVISGSESWLIRACLGAFRGRVTRQELEIAQEWLWVAEAFIARAPWLSTTLDNILPLPEDYLGIAASYRLLGHEARAQFYARNAERDPSGGSSTDPAPTDWTGEYFTTLYRALPGRAREPRIS